MSKWLVTQGNDQFSVEGIGELKDLASSGRLKGGDMIQPPGANDWVYASEVPQLAALLSSSTDEDDDFMSHKKKGAAAMITAVVAVLFLGVAVVGAGAMFMMMQQLPSGNERLIGEGGLTYSQMIITEAGSGLRSEPSPKASLSSPLAKDSVLELLAKRGEFYRARSKSGAEGWIPVNHVIPMYQLGGTDVREEFDPLYNPDRYVEVVNARWMQLPPETAGEENNITVFEFMFSNSSMYDMTDIVILATVKDEKGQQIEAVEIPLEGVIPSKGQTMVGSLAPEDAEKLERQGKEVIKRRLMTYSFKELAKDDPELQLRFTSGVEVEMKSEEFTNAEIDILEIRAVPLAQEE